LYLGFVDLTLSRRWMVRDAAVLGRLALVVLCLGPWRRIVE
jgi:hypothetical protein